MIPETLIPARFHISSVEPAAMPEENNEDLAQSKITLADYEPEILAVAAANGKSRNLLLEERDRHIKDRLFRVVKIEAFARVLNDQQMEGDIDIQELTQIINEQTDKINTAGNEIWLNLITRETTAPLFYDFQAE